MSTITGPLAELADAVTEVPLVDGTQAHFVNFDYAASAPPLASVHRVVTTAMAHYASIQRGQSYLSRVSTAAYERAGGGALIGRRDWLDEAPPHQLGGGAVVSVTTDGVQWKPSPARHEGGTPNLVGAVSLGAAFEALDQLGFEAIGEHERLLHGRLLDGLLQLGIEALHLA